MAFPLSCWAGLYVLDRFELAEMWKQCVWPCVYILDQRREARGTAVPPTEGSPLSARVWEKADPDESDVLKHILHINQSLFSALCILPPFYTLIKSLILLGSLEISSVCYNYSECSLLVWGQVKLMIGAMSMLGTGSGIIPYTALDIHLISDFLLLNLLPERFLLWHCNAGYLCCQAKTVLFRFFCYKISLLGNLSSEKHNLRSAWTLILVQAGLAFGPASQCRSPVFQS